MVITASHPYLDKKNYVIVTDVTYVLFTRMHKSELIQVHLGDTPHSLVESDFEYLASKTEGFSGSDIAVCVSSNFLFSFFILFLCFGRKKNPSLVLVLPIFSFVTLPRCYCQLNLKILVLCKFFLTTTKLPFDV